MAEALPKALAKIKRDNVNKLFIIKIERINF